MLAGHLAVGLALKARYREVPLLVLLFSVQLLDWIWLVLAWQGVEHFRIFFATQGPLQLDLYDVRYSHAMFWSVFYGAAVFILFARAEGRRHWAVPLGLGIFSHWVLDAIWYSDLPFANFGPELRLGLGLNSLSPFLTLGLEGGLVMLCWWIYYRSRRAMASGALPLWLSLGLLVLMLFSNQLLTSFSK